LNKNQPILTKDADSPDSRLLEITRLLEGHVQRGLDGLGGRKDGQPIRELHIELTHLCNLRCTMCHHWEMPIKDPSSLKREMNLEQIRTLVTGSKKLKDVEIVVLTGGEPMLRADIVEIVAFLANHYPRASIGVLTNLWDTDLVRRRLAAFHANGASRIWLGSSLDGLESAHDEVRGRKGSFQGLLDSVKMLRAEFPKTDFSFSFTITPRNYQQLWSTYRLVSDMGLWFGAQMVVNHQEKEAPETYSWEPDQLRAIEAQIDLILLDLCHKEKAWERLNDGAPGEHLWLWTRLLYWWYLKKYAHKPERFFKDCMAGQRYAMLDPEGEVFFCPVNKHRDVGNVLTQSFDELWTSKKAEDERAFVDSCKCDCWLNCIANPILDRSMAIAMEKPWGN
jgi:MoaA/NifB/PqqE/SkfB family radical SAM enzyme